MKMTDVLQFFVALFSLVAGFSWIMSAMVYTPNLTIGIKLPPKVSNKKARANLAQQSHWNAVAAVFAGAAGIVQAADLWIKYLTSF